MDPKSVAIVISTFYPRWYYGSLRSIAHTDKIRGDLAIELIESAKKLGYQIVVVDGHSSKSFRHKLARIEEVKVVIRRKIRRSPGKREGFKIASKIDGVKVIVLTDPEKVSFVHHCIPSSVAPILEGKADIIIPKREPRRFKSSYPSFQFDSETEGNQIYNEYLRVHGLRPSKSEDLDLLFGPRIFANDPKVLSLFMRKFSFAVGGITFPRNYFDPEELANAAFFPIILALKKKLRVESIEVPFTYPELQKENEEIGNSAVFLEKRRRQRLSLLVELMHFVSYLQNNPSSRVKRSK